MESGGKPPAPRTWTSRILLPAWLVFTLVLGLLYARVPPNDDNAVYDYVGWVLSQGGSLYVDAADNNWPGICLLHGLAAFLFGNTLFSWHVLDYLLLLPSCGVLFIFVRRAFGLTAGLVVVPLYQVMYVSMNASFSGQRDIVLAPFLVLAALAFWMKVETGRPWWPAVQGVAVALAVLIRPTYLLLPALLAVVDLCFRKKTGRSIGLMFRDHALAAGSLLLVFAVGALIGWRSGATREWYRMAVVFNLEMEPDSGETLGSVLLYFLQYAIASWKWTLPVVLLSIATHWRRRPLALALLLAIAATTMLSALVQMKGYPYHWGPLWLLMAVFMAPVIGEALEGFRREPPRVIRSIPVHRALCGLLCALVVVGLGKKFWVEMRNEAAWIAGRISKREFYARYVTGDGLPLDSVLDITEHIEKTTAPDRCVLYWGSARMVNYLSRRRSFGRFGSLEPLILDRDPGPRQSAAAAGLFQQWEQEMNGILAHDPPELILVQKDLEIEGAWMLPKDRKHDRLGYHILDLLPTDYQLERRFGSVECYRRKPK